MDALLTTLMDLSWPDLAKLLAIAAVIGVGPTVKAALNSRIKRWGDRDRHSEHEDVDVDRVTQNVRKHSFLAKTVPAAMVRGLVREHRKSDPPVKP